MKKILCAGLAVADIIARPVPPDIMSLDTARVSSVELRTGGDALNTASAFVKLGGRADLAAVVGDDAFGNFIRGELKRTGVGADRLYSDERAGTSISVVLLEESGERHFAYRGEANDLFSEDMVPDSAFGGAAALYVGSAFALKSLDGDGLERLFKRAKSKGLITAFDATADRENVWLPKIEKALYHADIFIPSESEIREIAGTEDLKKIAPEFKKYGLKVFGVKLGERGSYLTDFKSEYDIPAFRPEKLADTTGAGDSYNAGFLTAYLDGRPLKECGLFASAVSKFCIEAVGATTNIPNAQKVENFLRSKGYDVF
jgi:Sugar kinases, ribokinase family